MREAKRFKTLKGFTVFFTLGVLFSLIFCFVVGANGTQTGVLNILSKLDSTLTHETLNIWADWAMLAACIFGIFQLIFMCCAFSAGAKALKKGRMRTVQTSVYMNSGKQEKRMKKEAYKASKKESKMKTKQEKIDLKETKKRAKLELKKARMLKKEEKPSVLISPKKAEAKKVSKVEEHKEVVTGKTRSIEDILKNM